MLFIGGFKVCYFGSSGYRDFLGLLAYLHTRILIRGVFPMIAIVQRRISHCSHFWDRHRSSKWVLSMSV